MALESGSYISDLNSSNPASADGLSQADDHIRLLKATLLATFPSITGAVTASHTNLNAAVTAVITDGVAKLADAGVYFKTDTNTGLTNPGADQLALVTGGTARVTATTSGASVTGDLTVSDDLDVTDGVTIGGDLAVTGPISGGTGQLVPTGTVLDYAGSSAPTGFLLCYGQAVSRTTYSALFAIIGETYGAGNGVSTFNVPDLRGRVAAGKDNMGGSAASNLSNATTLGGTQGAKDKTLVEANLPAHAHAQTAQNPTFTYSVTSVQSGSGQTVVTSIQKSGGLVGPIETQEDATPGNTGNGSGTSTAFGIVQPTMILNKIIKI